VHSLLINPVKSDELLVCTRSNAVHSMTVQGSVARSWTSGKAEDQASFVAATVSPRGSFLYCLATDGNLYCFNTAAGRLDHVLEVHKQGTAIGLAHHPHRNLVATFADEPELKIWQA
jgi:WD40 repeat-containing protein SMU1